MSSSSTSFRKKSDDEIQKLVKLAKENGVKTIEEAIHFAMKHKKETEMKYSSVMKSPKRTATRRYARSMSEQRRTNRPVVKRHARNSKQMLHVGPTKIPGFAFDIGGTLCKVVYFSPDEVKLRRQRSNSEVEGDNALRDFILNSTTYGQSGKRDKEFQFHSITTDGTFHFIKFETRLMKNAFRIIKEKKIDRGLRGRIYATGGGAVAFASDFKEEFDVLSSIYKLGRVRILLKQPRTTLSWHRDPEPRLHIPIITNPGCHMVIDNVAKHLPADGSVWITNNTKYHNAFNGGEENRIHLVACVLDHKFN